MTVSQNYVVINRTVPQNFIPLNVPDQLLPISGGMKQGGFGRRQDEEGNRDQRAGDDPARGPWQREADRRQTKDNGSEIGRDQNRRNTPDPDFQTHQMNQPPLVTIQQLRQEMIQQQQTFQQQMLLKMKQMFQRQSVWRPPIGQWPSLTQSNC